MHCLWQLFQVEISYSLVSTVQRISKRSAFSLFQGQTMTLTRRWPLLPSLITNLRNLVCCDLLFCIKTGTWHLSECLAAILEWQPFWYFFWHILLPFILSCFNIPKIILNTNLFDLKSSCFPSKHVLGVPN